MTVLGPTLAGRPHRWQDKLTGEVLVAVAVKPCEGLPPMVLPIHAGRTPHPLDWWPEAGFLRRYEAVA